MVPGGSRGSGPWPAMLFAHPDQEGVVFIKELHVSRETRLEQFLDLIIIGGIVDQPVTDEDAAV